MHDLARIFGEVKTPAYVLDVAALKRNLKVIEELRAKTGIKILLATKAFSMFSAFPLLQDYFDGTTASGFYEARLGAEHFGKEVHVYSPAYTDTEMADLLPIADDVYFNSNSQLQKFLPMIHESGRGIKIGLRVNPEFSSVKHEIYNPCSPNSRFGVVKDKLAEIDFSNIDILHFHALCENMAEDSVALIEHVSEVFSDYISKVKAVNFGGGHYITHPDYDLPKLLAALNKFRKKFDVEVILEPGGAVVYNSGYLLASVVDITQNQKQIAILDISATCHMPDVLEMPYRPNIIGAGQAQEKAHNYIIGGRTCLTGDVIGEYSFDAPLREGDRLVFEDMMQYSMVKNTTFNGTPLPDIAILHEDGRYEIAKEFGYEDFKSRLS